MEKAKIREIIAAEYEARLKEKGIDPAEEKKITELQSKERTNVSFTDKKVGKGV
jgi:hypothetical protein